MGTIFNDRLAERAGTVLERMRQSRPLIHNITNFVVMNYTANALLAIGASPVMAHAPEEVEEMVSLAGALVLNIGTLSSQWIESMVKAGKRANEIGVPVILDPVGAGATKMRTDAAKRLLHELSIGMIRGNPSEVLSLSSAGARTRGVDSAHGVDEAVEASRSLANEIKTTLAITGPVDLVTDGRRMLRIHNGHALMGRVTGTGCTATAIVASFMAVEKDPLLAAAAALAFFGLAGQMAAEKAEAPGSFQIALLDALFLIRPEDLGKGARIEGPELGGEHG